MWILHWLPDDFLNAIVNAILALGVISTLLSFFVINKILRLMPALASYYRLIQVASVLILVGGVYLKGGYSTEMEWRERVAELETKLEEAKKESGKVNTVIETKVITKNKIIKQKADTIIEYVDRVIPAPAPAPAAAPTASGESAPAPVASNANMCVNLPQEAIDVHNEAAKMNKALEQMKNGAKK